MPLSLGRLVVLVVVCALASVGLTVASARNTPPQPLAAIESPKAPELVVPDVRGQAYVFAKSTLERAGFAWRVKGRVPGFAGMVVTSQSPAPGARVVDSGDPFVNLRLLKPSGYVPAGEAQDVAPYPGTAVELVAGEASKLTTTPAKTGRPPAPSKTEGTTAPVKARAAATTPRKRHVVAHARRQAPRPPAFHVAGGKTEPLDEMPLPQRATMLAGWLERHLQPTAANQRHWLFQHSWIVAGARLGWWHGAAALRTLIRVDQRAEKVWGLGARSEAEARQALRFVEARTR